MDCPVVNLIWPHRHIINQLCPCAYIRSVMSHSSLSLFYVCLQSKESPGYSLLVNHDSFLPFWTKPILGFSSEHSETYFNYSIYKPLRLTWCYHHCDVPWPFHRVVQVGQYEASPLHYSSQGSRVRTEGFT